MSGYARSKYLRLPIPIKVCPKSEKQRLLTIKISRRHLIFMLIFYHIRAVLGIRFEFVRLVV